MSTRSVPANRLDSPANGRGLLVAAIAVSTLALGRAETAPMVIDDFSTGDYHAAVPKETRDHTPGRMIGGSRATTVMVTRNLYGQTANVDVVTRAGVMAVNTGISSLVRVELRYGYDARGGANPLNLDLSRHDEVSIDLVATDRAINYNVVLFSAGGSQREPWNPTGWEHRGHRKDLLRPWEHRQAAHHQLLEAPSPLRTPMCTR